MFKKVFQVLCKLEPITLLLVLEFEKNNLSLGRANSERCICLMNLDIDLVEQKTNKTIG